MTQDIDDLVNYVPEPWSMERAKDLRGHTSEMDQMARDGEFGFQIMMMHPTGHIQMVHDIKLLVEFWIDNQVHFSKED